MSRCGITSTKNKSVLVISVGCFYRTGGGMDTLVTCSEF